MYIPEMFAVTDEAEIADMLRRIPLGSVVTRGREGLFASQLPFVHDPRKAILAGHLARANPHWRLASEEEALVIFQGANAYVTPNWYPSKGEHGRVVPTWNYETVHVYGRITWREDRDWLLGNVRALTEQFEAAQPMPWAVDDAPADHIDRLLGGIVGLELQIGRVEAKRKLSQNRPEADRQGVISGLTASPSELDRVMGDVMQSQSRGQAK
jgi:transcriptional regulator